MLISTAQLAERTGLSKPTLWRYRQRYRDFPKPIHIEGTNVIRWVAAETDAWFLARRARR